MICIQYPPELHNLPWLQKFSTQKEGSIMFFVKMSGEIFLAAPDGLDTQHNKTKAKSQFIPTLAWLHLYNHVELRSLGGC